MQHFKGGVRRFPTHGTGEWERLSSAQQGEGGEVLPMERQDLQRFGGQVGRGGVGAGFPTLGDATSETTFQTTIEVLAAQGREEGK